MRLEIDLEQRLNMFEQTEKETRLNLQLERKSFFQRPVKGHCDTGSLQIVGTRVRL